MSNRLYETIPARHLVGLANVHRMEDGAPEGFHHIVHATPDGGYVRLTFADGHTEKKGADERLYVNMLDVRVWGRSLDTLLKNSVRYEMYQRLHLSVAEDILIDSLRFFGVQELAWARCAIDDYVHGWPLNHLDGNHNTTEFPDENGFYLIAQAVHNWTIEQCRERQIIDDWALSDEDEQAIARAEEVMR